MKKNFQVLIASLGFILALFAGSSEADAQADSQLSESGGGSCVETGHCGTTAGGVKLNGFWRESSN